MSKVHLYGVYLMASGLEALKDTPDVMNCTVRRNRRDTCQLL